MNTGITRDNRLDEYQDQEQGFDKKYIQATDLLEDIWLNINWENMNKGRMLKIWSEFENQVKALSKCYSRLEPFLTKICKRFNSYLNKYQTKEILVGDQEVILNVFREEIQIPMLLLRLKRENQKEKFKVKEKENEKISLL